MNVSEIAVRADQRLSSALAAGARDPREFYRKQLMELKTSSPAAYRRAVTYYQEELLPAVAADDSDPLAEWLEYGRVLAELTVPGRAMVIDPSGLATPYARPVAADALVLHLPQNSSAAALPVGLPGKLSPAQRATYDLLVKQAQRL